MPRLRRADPAAPGIVRRRRGRGFSYHLPDGSPLHDPAERERIDALAIPPAWTDVWICTDPLGHIQAIGTDAAGRRQYRYHDEWRRKRDLEKFDRILDFADLLPRMRERICADLDQPGLGRHRVLAGAARLLDVGFFRVGGEEYAEQNNTYGLATLLREHVAIEDGTVTFEYVAKAGKERVQAVADEAVCEVVRELLERDDDGPELLAYQDENGNWVDVTSRDINEYLQELSGGLTITAKDFRTWSATVLCAVALAVSERAATSPSAIKRAVTRAVKETASYLGNTPAVCRASYIHPKVIDLFAGGVTISEDLDRLGADVAYGELAVQGDIEAAVRDLLRNPQAARIASRKRRMLEAAGRRGTARRAA